MKTSCSVMFLLLLASCSLAPPLIAFPGDHKNYADFQQDDAICREAASHPANGTPAPAGVAVQTPNLVYAQCMVSRGDKVGPPPPPPPVPIPAYGYVYSGFGDSYPWLY